MIYTRVENFINKLVSTVGYERSVKEKFWKLFVPLLVLLDKSAGWGGWRVEHEEGLGSLLHGLRLEFKYSATKVGIVLLQVPDHVSLSLKQLIQVLAIPTDKVVLFDPLPYQPVFVLYMYFTCTSTCRFIEKTIKILLTLEQQICGGAQVYMQHTNMYGEYEQLLE